MSDDDVTVEVGLGDRAYDILIGAGLLARAGAEIARAPARRRAPRSSPTRTSPPRISTR